MLMSCGCNLWIKSFRAFWLHRLYATALVLLHRDKVMNLFNQDQIKEIFAKFRNLNSATLNAVKGEKCHLDFGGRVQVFGEETYLQDRFEK